MQARTMRVTCVAAYSVWTAACLVVIAGTATLVAGLTALALALYAHGALVTGAAVVMSIRAIAERSAMCDVTNPRA